jgi:hypothetical protein
MNVGQLKELLKDFPDDMTVVLSEFAEGNHCSELSGAGTGKFLYGSLYDEPELLSEVADGWLDQEDADTAISVLSLWPA